MNLFDDIVSVKKDFPRLRSINDTVKKFNFNFYQKFAIGIFVICFFLGIILGNLFATCTTASFFYSDGCAVSVFNFSLMIFIWFCGLLISVMFYSIGHIIQVLMEISEKLSKFHI